ATMRFAHDAADEAELRQLAHHAGHDVARHKAIAVFAIEQRVGFGGEKPAQRVDRHRLLCATEHVAHACVPLILAQEIYGDHRFLDAEKAAAVLVRRDARPLDLARASLAAKL